MPMEEQQGQAGQTQQEQSHHHGKGCGHLAVEHRGHVDYLQEGHLQHRRGDAVEEHVLDVSPKNPAGCQRVNKPTHQHGPGCGHEAIPHGDHVDYIVDGHLEHPHGDHCDDHGPVKAWKD